MSKSRSRSVTVSAPVMMMPEKRGKRVAVYLDQHFLDNIYRSAIKLKTPIHRLIPSNNKLRIVFGSSGHAMLFALGYRESKNSY